MARRSLSRATSLGLPLTARWPRRRKRKSVGAATTGGALALVELERSPQARLLDRPREHAVLLHVFGELAQIGVRRCPAFRDRNGHVLGAPAPFKNARPRRAVGHFEQNCLVRGEGLQLA